MIKIDDKVTICQLKGEKPEYHYSSSVADVLGENQFLFYMPQVKKVVFKPSVGSRHEFVLYTPGGLYSGEGTVLGFVWQNNVLLMKAEIDELEYTQRRDFFRVDVSIPMTYSLPENQEPLEDGTLPLYKGKIGNLSASGLCFITDRPLQEQMTIEINFPDEILPDAVKAEILSSTECLHKVNGHKAYKTRVRYRNLTSRRQERIIRYVFKAEREIILRKRNVLE
ncbi:flagellar brake protein [Scatolibacter rhodanostii]|uniref:flagellar brake protein n=1 Tax=Scatolibacter rhodanostii TaxID=2014781 RepID=UPI000C06CBDD|nr:PilZ domain-containing protein [Scatolibacter rhodanostii]